MVAGSENATNMLIIQPSADDDDALQILMMLDEKLSKSEKVFEILVKQGDPSLRRIQGKRYEVFVHSRSKPSGVFDVIAKEIASEWKNDNVKMSPKKVKNTLLDYARTQAFKDPRIKEKYQFDNYSFLVSYGKVPAQLRHIDLLSPNAQFGLIMTNGSPGTISYTPDYHIRNVRDLERAWPDLPQGVAEAIKQQEHASEILSRFGDVLCPVLTPAQQPQSLSRGTLLSLPGSVVHAGPACSRYRAVLFFSGWPDGAQIARYNPDTQYFASMVGLDLATILWSRLKNLDDKTYLLRKAADLIRNDKKEGHKTLHRHLNDPRIKNFAYRIAEGKYPKDKRDEYIEEFAKTAEVRGIIPVPGGVGEEWVLESVDDLVVEYEGEPYAARIYRRPDNSVVIKYLADGTTEGAGSGERYTLTYHDEKKTQKRGRRLFDGTNGTLRDTEEVEIKCSRENKRLRARG